LWQALKRRSFPDFEFFGRSKPRHAERRTAPEGQEPTTGDRRKAEWVYTGLVLEAKMEIPAEQVGADMKIRLVFSIPGKRTGALSQVKDFMIQFSAWVLGQHQWI
jgi:hypothetical protein